MGRFPPGVSGNPGGRPLAARGLRGVLEAKFGRDGEPLIGRLEELSKSKNGRVALEAVKVLLSYLAGPPERTLHLDVAAQATPWTEVQLAMLSTEDLNTLAAITRRVHPNNEGERALIRPDGRDDSEAQSPPSETS
jgi:hypothetical protein